MGSPPSSPENGDQPALAPEDSSGKAASSPHHKMSPRNRALFFLTAWLIVLMPFLFWWNTWFGRQLSDKQIGEFLNDEKHPRHIQHALVQLGEHMGRHDPGVKPLYPELIRLAWHPVEEVRNTDAWVMGQDTSRTGLHEPWLTMLQDSSPMVRGNAALSLVRFGDSSGRAQIVALLQSARIIASRSGRVTDVDQAGTPIHQGGLVAKLQDGRQTTELRSPIRGRIRTISVAPGTHIAAGTEIATVDPGDGQVWEALRALYLIGQTGDLPAIGPYQRELPEISERVRQQALLTEKSIRDRASAQQP